MHAVIIVTSPSSVTLSAERLDIAGLSEAMQRRGFQVLAAVLRDEQRAQEPKALHDVHRIVLVQVPHAGGDVLVT